MQSIGSEPRLSSSSVPCLFIPRRFSDSRGWFCETYNAGRLAGEGVDVSFVQDNQSYSARRGTVRGLHFQVPPHGQGKLVR
ncbi:dTDP-4-dehydrorhamnose 3,5-epimerase, partial [Rhodoplanes roseus]